MTQTLTTKLKSVVAAFTALALSLALVPASAFAALVEFNDSSVSSKISSGSGTTGTITITGDLSSSDVTITVYRVASILLDSDTNESKWVAADDNTSNPTNETELAKLITTWISAYSTDSNGNPTGSTTDKAAAAEAIAAEVADSNNTWVTSSDVTSSATISKGSLQTTISDLLPGIYYVKITDITGAVAYQPIITSIEMVASGNNDNTWKIENPEDIACKSASTTVEKEVLYTNADGLYEDGDRIAFVVKFSIESSLSEFYFWDTMTGLTFDNTTGITFYSAEPTVDDSGNVSGSPISVTRNTHYELYTDESTHDAVYYVNNDGHSMGSSATFHVDVLSSGIDALYGATNGTGEIWIVYWATVDGTTAATDGISNSFNTSIASGGVTDPDNTDPDDIPGGSTLDLSTGFQIFKYDDDDKTALNGAKFAIYEATVGTEVLDSDGNVIGYSTLSVASNASSLDTIETAEDTTYNIDGYGKTSSILFQADKVYAIAETSAPSGYNLMDGYIYVLVNYDGTSNTLTYDSDNGYWVIGTQYTEATVDTTTPSLAYAGYTTIGVPNTASDALTGDGSGIGLPTTGGMGTILFTVLGVLIMAGAAYLIIRSRKQQQQQG